ncbi:hypothetical protein TL16_g06943 [Triparma laevis f. inornata]|uniref:Uncharacterized protein n=1 Tax=Triparma laevis f. inornata TaxID=1714386 RepID=A0A9W7AY26_9STRA|nr:hypothetical protein TL16_g06943 [Triparma laevis f. inornata]
MGGQSALSSSSYANATDHNITSAAMHHVFTHEYPAPQVPFLAFTGGLDYVAWRSMTKNFYGNPNSDVTTKGIVDRTSANHFEPEDNFQPWESYNPLVPQFTAAWFKLTIDKKQEEFGFDFHEMIFGDSNDLISNGGDGYMNTCEMLD